MSVHRLSAAQVVPVSLEEAWGFFSSPRNLEHMTPPSLGMTPAAAKFEIEKKLADPDFEKAYMNGDQWAVDEMAKLHQLASAGRAG